MSTNKREIAMQNFKDGCNCAQSVVLAFAEEMNMDQKTALRISSSFGGGMGRLREVCGAVSGMLIVAGTVLGYDNIQDHKLKTEHYKRVQDLAGEFREKNNYIVCRELLGLKKEGPDNYVPEIRTAEYYKKRPCMELVGDAAEILENYLKNENKLCEDKENE